ncbi:MAG: hypothetical protein SF052_21770 [Bacteroidia bacterium]|nr:hypothetical protein [Bacteroidia bacterium]
MKKSIKNIIGALLLLATLAGGAVMITQLIKTTPSETVSIQAVDMENSISVLP